MKKVNISIKSQQREGGTEGVREGGRDGGTEKERERVCTRNNIYFSQNGRGN